MVEIYGEFIGFEMDIMGSSQQLYPVVVGNKTYFHYIPLCVRQIPKNTCVMFQLQPVAFPYDEWIPSGNQTWLEMTSGRFLMDDYRMVTCFDMEV